MVGWDTVAIIQHISTLALTLVFVSYAYRLGKLLKFPKDLSFIIAGFALWGIGRAFILLNDFAVDNPEAYHIGLLLGTVGLIFEIIGVYTLLQRTIKITGDEEE